MIRKKREKINLSNKWATSWESGGPVIAGDTLQVRFAPEPSRKKGERLTEKA